MIFTYHFGMLEWSVNIIAWFIKDSLFELDVNY